MSGSGRRNQTVTMYPHFASKEAIFQAVYERIE